MLSQGELTSGHLNESENVPIATTTLDKTKNDGSNRTQDSVSDFDESEHEMADYSYDAFRRYERRFTLGERTRMAPKRLC